MTDEKLGKNWEQKRYEDTLTQVYTSQDEQETIFKAVRLRDYQDKEEVRLCIAKDDRLVKALQTPLSKLGEKINEEAEDWVGDLDGTVQMILMYLL